MKDLYIKRFNVRYQGQDYGPGTIPGSIIYDVSDELADELIAESNDTIEALPKREMSEKDNGQNMGGEISNDKTGLPPLDPKSSVK